MFYRYLTWNDYTKILLRSHSFHYSDPRTFNDIHECVVRPQAGSCIHGHHNLTLDAITNYQIYCLSKSKNHPLMWAHYANSYRGICLEFNFSAEDTHANLPQQVIYQNTPPIITDNELNTRTDISTKLFGFKHTQWAYEQEWRIFKPSNTDQSVPFHPCSLTAVYIGPVFSSAFLAT